jgi:hypothetical protein
MAGIEYMNDDPAEVDVLYGKVHIKDGPHVLQEVADGVVNHFCSKGLCLLLCICMCRFRHPATLQSAYPNLFAHLSVSLSHSLYIEQLKNFCIFY